MDEYCHIRSWVTDLPKIGRLSFSLEDARARFPNMSFANVQNALYRLSSNRQICSVWRGFYAIVLPEYGLVGAIPPTEYIDQLMAYIKTDYYIALLSAASYQGASHQSPQVFQVICSKQLRSKTVNGTRLEFIYKKKMPATCVGKTMVKSGYVNISKPALTAFDLISYPTRTGNIAVAATVLSELSQAIDFQILDNDLLRNTARSAIQRLGFILEHTLDEIDLANVLYEKCMAAKLQFNRTDLVVGQQSKNLGFDKRWNIAINYDLEVDR